MKKLMIAFLISGLLGSGYSFGSEQEQPKIEEKSTEQEKRTTEQIAQPQQENSFDLSSGPIENNLDVLQGGENEKSVSHDLPLPCQDERKNCKIELQLCQNILKGVVKELPAFFNEAKNEIQNLDRLNADLNDIANMYRDQLYNESFENMVFNLFRVHPVKAMIAGGVAGISLLTTIICLVKKACSKSEKKNTHYQNNNTKHYQTNDIDDVAYLLKY